MSLLFEQIQNLYTNHLYEDVLYLASTTLTYSERNSETFNSTIHFQLLFYQGMANYEIGDYKMAEASFKTALNIRKVHKLKVKKGAEVQSEAEVQFALHKCFLKMNNHVDALAMLEAISPSQRTPEMHASYIKLVSLNKPIKNTKPVISACKEIIKSNPLSLFAIKTLVQSGMGFDELDLLIKTSLPQVTTIEWLNPLIRAFIYVEKCDFKAAIDSFIVVFDSSWLFGNIMILTSIGEAYYFKGDYQRCIATFKQVHEIDKNYTNKMGIYAFVLHRESYGAELKKLAAQMMQCSKHSADVWVVLGFHQLLLLKYTQAYTFAQKALSIDSSNVEGLILKGLVSMEIKSESSEAVISFRKATQFMPNHFESYKCIVDYYLLKDSVQLATTAACEIHKLLPCARTNALYANILIKDPDNAEKTKTLLEHALQMDNECLDAVLLLARLHKNEGNTQAATDVLKQYQPSYSYFKYHQLMADILMSKDKLKALDHSVLALKLDPQIPKIHNFESPSDILDESDWLSGSAMPSRNLFREGVLAESPAHEQDLILDS